MMQLRQIYKILFTCFGMTASLGVFAAGPPNISASQLSTAREQIPSTVDSGVVGNRLQGKLLPAFKPAGKFVNEMQEQKTPENAAAEKIHFKLSNVSIKGNTVLPSAELLAIFKPYINTTISLAKLQELVTDVTKKYREAGYVLSRAILPPQTIKNGAVQVQVIEGFISKVNITGNPGLALSLLKEYGEQIKQMKPLQFKKLERDMLLMDDLVGISVKSVITPSKDIPGSADLTLVVDRQPVTAFASYDNLGTRYLGPQETTVGFSLNSVLFPGDTNAFRAVTTAQTTQLQFYEITHAQPIGINGTQIVLGGNYSNTKPGFLLRGFDVIGRSFSLFGDLSNAVLRTRSENILLHSGFNYQNVSSTILGTPFYFDRIRSLILGAKFDAVDSWHGANNLGVDLEHGFKIMGAHFDPATQSRPEGVPNFTKYTVKLSRLQGISSRFSLLAAFQVQYAFNPLLATEQYAYGGADFGRGYDPSSIIGDDGLAGKLELRMDTAPELRFLQQIQYYAFYDGGMIWNRDTTNLPAKQSAFSTGFGARFGFMPNLSGNLFIAKPLTLKVATLQASGQNATRCRVFFQITANI